MANANPALVRGMQESVRSQLLQRKLLVAEILEADKKATYQLFKNELTLYNVTCIVAHDTREADLVARQLKDGAGFLNLAEKYHNDQLNPKGQIGLVTLGEIKHILGAPAARAFAKLERGDFSQPIPSAYGILFLRYTKTVNSYEELVPNVEDLMLAAVRPGAMRKLVDSAKITAE